MLLKCCGLSKAKTKFQNGGMVSEKKKQHQIKNQTDIGELLDFELVYSAYCGEAQ